jgi:hypothetical protein
MPLFGAGGIPQTCHIKNKLDGVKLRHRMFSRYANLKTKSPHMKIITMITALVALGGCAATGVVPIGQDTYMVSRQGAGGWSSVGKLKAEAFAEASQYCVSQNKSVQVVNTREQPSGIGRLPEAEVQFMCLSANDRELVRPKLRKDADTVVEIRK